LDSPPIPFPTTAVIKAIKALDCSREFKELNFEVSSYKPEGAKRSYPMYLMTRDGFTFLAMGFTLPVFPFLLPLAPANQSRRSIDTDSRTLSSTFRF